MSSSLSLPLEDPESVDPPAPDAPLAERLRPRSLDEVIGQQHLLGPGKPLRSAFERGRLHSMILWGPPGVGKTTLARLVAGAFDAQFIAISAVLGGVKDIRDAVERAQAVQAQGRRTVVFVDEVHRFNKSQQDAFLPHVESGLFTFIGATTENPSFEVNSALLSRATVHVLKPLSEADLRTLLERARTLLAAAPMSEAATARLIGYADGDARRLLNAYENLVEMAGDAAELDEPLLERSLGEQLRRYDKGGEQFYDTISALHKAVRGSDPDAALYWFVRMLDGGVDPRYAARRLVRMAVEDIGLADPRALRLALDAAETYERLGSPEGELALAEAVVYLAVAAKSNAVYTAYKSARAFVAADGTRPVPLHLRNAPTKLMKALDYGKGYRYAHDEEGAFAAGESYWPEDLPGPPAFYRPAPRGLEIRIGEKLEELRRLNEAAKKPR
ncbi:MAG: replication-associated recombination protein A [Piscinibacter sp.]|uniref:replication-associated recombination protein A n=1 Tax=Piscinibacter sp. TaxID=1903157 RepID=UPI00258E0D16|nr:replication-associated recombination protein A [Piscinibacter sp.]MCW5662750.1 replication-associated recombination protein A [Piscinibacter sp.]